MRKEPAGTGIRRGPAAEDIRALLPTIAGNEWSTVERGNGVRLWIGVRSHVQLPAAQLLDAVPRRGDPFWMEWQHAPACVVQQVRAVAGCAAILQSARAVVPGARVENASVSQNAMYRVMR